MLTRDRAVDFATMIVAACTLAVTSVFVYRQFAPSAGATTARGVSAPRENRPVSAWRRELESGHKMGPDSALVRIVYYGDFECPACRSFAAAVQRVERAFPGSLQVVFRHYPLEYHRFAYASARAAECAAQQSRFEAMYHALYAAQDSLGVIPWRVLAGRASVPDLGSFDACTRDTGRVARVERDRTAGEILKIPGTPAVIVDGVLVLEKAVSAQYLEARVRDARQRRR